MLKMTDYQAFVAVAYLMTFAALAVGIGIYIISHEPRNSDSQKH
jgi:heme exporter protein D